MKFLQYCESDLLNCQLLQGRHGTSFIPAQGWEQIENSVNACLVIFVKPEAGFDSYKLVKNINLILSL